jgi:epoxide hydrolase-like predicted phosphatase
MIKAILFDNDGVLSEWFIPKWKVRIFAKFLKRHGFKIGMLSNVWYVLLPLYKLSHSYIGFDVMLLSCQEKMSKPNPKFYELAVKKLGVKPEEIIFIDNKAHWLEPAKELGMKTIQATSSAQIINDIKRIIEKENNLKLL